MGGNLALHVGDEANAVAANRRELPRWNPMSEATMLNVLITSRELPPRTRNRPDDRFQQMEVGTIADTLSPSTIMRAAKAAAAAALPISGTPRS